MTTSVPLATSFSSDQVLGIGRTGLVIQREDTAIKLPIRWTESSDNEIEANLESLQREQDIYKRLGKHDGIVNCIDITPTSIQLALMKNGDLHTYLSRKRPTKSRQFFWLREMVSALAYIHERCIIVSSYCPSRILRLLGLG